MGNSPSLLLVGTIVLSLVPLISLCGVSAFTHSLSWAVGSLSTCGWKGGSAAGVQ